jgi:hypothetical protein
MKRNGVHDKIRRRLICENVYYYTVLKLLSSYLQSRIQKLKISKTIILPLVLYTCEKFQVFKNKVFIKVFGPKKDYIMSNLVIYTGHLVLLG